MIEAELPLNGSPPPANQATTPEPPAKSRRPRGKIARLRKEDRFARLVHALARASRETLNLQKHREAAAKAVAAELKRLDPNRELNGREHDLFMKKVQEYFHLKPAQPASSQTDTASSPLNPESRTKL